MPIANWPSIVDDDGTGTTGTALDKAFFDDIQAAIEDETFSITNPTINPATITDEVVEARGGFDDLDARLDDIESDIGSVETPESSSLVASENVARNPDLLSWSGGGAVAPDHFTLTGTGASVARTGDGDADTTIVGAGFNSAKITFGSDAAKLTQALVTAADFAAQGALSSQSRKVSITIMCKASVVDQARIAVNDGVTTTNSDYHAGDSVTRPLTVTHTISGSATKIDFYMEVAQAGAAYFGGIIVTFSDSAAPNWAPRPGLSRRTLKIDTTEVGNVGAPETDLMQYKISPNLLHANGVTLHFVLHIKTAANGTTKAAKFYFGSTSITLFSGTYNNKAAVFDVYVARLSAASQVMFATGSISTASITVENATPTEDETTEITAKVTGDANADNDILQKFMMTEMWEAVD